MTVPVADPRLKGRAVKRIAFDEETIARRVQELGREITAAYPEGDLLVLGLLKGSFIFLSDLVRHIAATVAGGFSRGLVVRRRDGKQRCARALALRSGNGIGGQTHSTGRGHCRFRANAQSADRPAAANGSRVHSRSARCCTSTSPRSCSIPRGLSGLTRRTNFWWGMDWITPRTFGTFHTLPACSNARAATSAVQALAVYPSHHQQVRRNLHASTYDAESEKALQRRDSPRRSPSGSS
jgi:hypothetical protein